MMTTTYKFIFSILLFCCFALPAGSQGENAEHQDGSVEQIRTLCREKGLADTESEKLLAPVVAAQNESLPVENIISKIEEGFAKKVDSALIARAAESRLDYLRRAEQLSRFVRHGHGGGARHLISRIALVLEGGLPDEIIQNMFRHAEHIGQGRLIHIIDAGAELYQAGFDFQQTQLIMMDCLDRHLNGAELTRVLDFLLKEHAAGRDFQSIYQDLWIRPD